MIQYTFPFDSLNIKNSSPILKDISFIKTNENAKIEFDANRGSFLTLGKQAILKLDFDHESIKKEDAKYEINFFIKLNNASDINSIQINDSQAVFNIDELKPEEKTTIITNTWLNVNLSIRNNKMIASIFDSYKKELEIDKMTFLKLLGTENFVSYSQLTINKNGESTKIEPKSSDDLSKKIEVNIHSENAYVVNQLIIEEDPKDVYLEVFFADLNIKQIPKNTTIGKLKAKKGFFSNSANGIIDEIEISTEFQQEFSNNKLVIKLPNVKVANLADQEKALLQVELLNISLNGIEIKEDNSLKIDQQVSIIDNRGLNICPFEVFILGNDTLYNGADNSTQAIKILINNISGNNIAFTKNSGFKVSTNFTNILKGDALQTKNIKLLEYISLIDIPTNPNDYIYFQKEFSLLSNSSFVLCLSGLQAKLSEKSNPSGAYPFYLEYKNIPGYRNGKVKFYIKTGKIFYQ